MKYPDARPHFRDKGIGFQCRTAGAQIAALMLMKRPTPGPAVVYVVCVVCGAVFQDVAKAAETCRVFGNAVDRIPSGAPPAMLCTGGL